MDGLDLLGASTSALSHQYITLRVKNIDVDVLKSKIGSKGSLIEAALPLINSEPKALLDLAAPFIGKAASAYGIDVETTVSNAPPSKVGRPYSEFWPGLLTGAIVGGVSVGLMRLLFAAVFRR